MVREILYWISWVGAPISLFGAYLVAADKNRLVGFWLLFTADILCSGVQVYDKIWSQVFLLLAFGVMNIIGIRKVMQSNG